MNIVSAEEIMQMVENYGGDKAIVNAANMKYCIDCDITFMGNSKRCNPCRKFHRAEQKRINNDKSRR